MVEAERAVVSIRIGFVETVMVTAVVVSACNAGSPAPATSCEALSVCCARTSGVVRTTCEATVSAGLTSACLAALVTDQASGVCAGENGSDARTDVEVTTAGGDGAVGPDPCGDLAPCCDGQPSGSQCSIAVGSKNATFCQQELDSLSSTGECGAGP